MNSKLREEVQKMTDAHIDSLLKSLIESEEFIRNIGQFEMAERLLDIKHGVALEHAAYKRSVS